MAFPDKLSTDEVNKQLVTLNPDWNLVSGRLRREFSFANFIEAFSFMSAVALHAEAASHHPNWSNVYNRVEIDLFTHEADGITRFDFELAAKIDVAAANATA